LTRFYRYILASDDGHAPCIDDGLVTLCTCKPQIRRAAQVGDWVAGYMPKGIAEGQLSWIGLIAEAMSPTDYERRFRGRRDAQYRLAANGNIERVDNRYHPGAAEQRKDLSAKVLIFDPEASWYFGDQPMEPPSTLDALKAAGQGHRVNFRLPDDLEQIEDWLRRSVRPGIHGRPRAEPTSDCASLCAPRRRKARSDC